MSRFKLKISPPTCNHIPKIRLHEVCQDFQGQNQDSLKNKSKYTFPKIQFLFNASDFLSKCLFIVYSRSFLKGDGLKKISHFFGLVFIANWCGEYDKIKYFFINVVHICNNFILAL